MSILINEHFYFISNCFADATSIPPPLMTDPVHHPPPFVRPEEIRCSTPTQVQVAETRLIHPSTVHNIDCYQEDDYDYAPSTNLPYADYDKIFSAALDLHLMEIGPIDHNHSSAGGGFYSEPSQFHLMDHPPSSNWTEDVRQAQSIIDQNVADMLATKLAKEGRGPPVSGKTKGTVTGGGGGTKKSFVVEFTSAKEYEQFLEFKNKLTASSCSSPSGDDHDSIDSLASSLFTRSQCQSASFRRRNEAGGDVLSMPAGETESYHHQQLSPTTPSISSLVSSDSSSYLATLTEESSSEEQEEVTNRDFNVPSPHFLVSCHPEAIPNESGNKELKDVSQSSRRSPTDDDDRTIFFNGINGGVDKGEEGAFTRACPQPSKESKQMPNVPLEEWSSSGGDSGDTNRRDVKASLDSSSARSDNNNLQEGINSSPRAPSVHSSAVTTGVDYSGGHEQGLNHPHPVPLVSIDKCSSTGIIPSTTGPSSTSTWRADENPKDSTNHHHRVCSSNGEAQSCGDLDCDCDLLNESSGYVCAENSLCTQDDQEVKRACEKSNSSFSGFQNGTSPDCDCGCTLANPSDYCAISSPCAVDYYSSPSAVSTGLLHNCSVESCCCSCQKSSVGNNNNSSNNNNIIACSTTEEGVGISNNDCEDSYDANVTFFSCCNSPLGDTSHNTSGGACCQQVCDKSDTDNLKEESPSSGCLKLRASATLKGNAVSDGDDFPAFNSAAHLEATVAQQSSEQGPAAEADTSVGSSGKGGVESDYESVAREYLAQRGASESDNNNLGLRAHYSSTSSLNSTLSENSASFVASNRLKRLEERLKKFHYAKKLISDSKDEDCLDQQQQQPGVAGGKSNLICDTEGVTSFDVTADEEDYDEEGHQDVDVDEQEKLIRDITARLQESDKRNQSVGSVVVLSLDRNNNSVRGLQDCDNNNTNELRSGDNRQFRSHYDDYDEAVTRFDSTPSPTESLDNNINNNNNSADEEHLIYDSDDVSKCTFNVKDVVTANYPEPLTIEECCYDELIDEQEATLVELPKDAEEECCDCILEAYPLCYVNKPGAIRSKVLEMREHTGPLRGLLKKPNRPPQQRKNRVVFDETRNEFFDADYIILIREDCPYDEEDEEPCTCGEHELVRLCCEEGCQCPGYIEGDGKTPQVRR